MVDVHPMAKLQPACDSLRPKLKAAKDSPPAGLSALGHNQLGKFQFDAAFHRYREITHWLLRQVRPEIEGMAYVDYGGGLGGMSLLARQLGFGKVLYVDIYQASCDDARLLGEATGLPADAYVCGGIEQLRDYATQHGIELSCMASHDVLEHIYDLDDFFQVLATLPGPCAAVMGTGANTHNRRIRRMEMRGHFDSEYKDHHKFWGQGLRDTRRSYFAVRCDIIRACDSALSQEEVEVLARATRGLIRDAIERCVREFRKTGVVSVRPLHPTNTCCPFTGYWAERLLPVGQYESIIARNGLHSFTTAGTYTGTRLLSRAANMLIGLLGKRSLWFAPYIIFVIKKTAQ